MRLLICKIITHTLDGKQKQNKARRSLEKGMHFCWKTTFGDKSVLSYFHWDWSSSALWLNKEQIKGISHRFSGICQFPSFKVKIRPIEYRYQCLSPGQWENIGPRCRQMHLCCQWLEENSRRIPWCSLLEVFKSKSALGLSQVLPETKHLLGHMIGGERHATCRELSASTVRSKAAAAFCLIRLSVGSPSTAFWLQDGVCLCF